MRLKKAELTPKESPTLKEVLKSMITSNKQKEYKRR